MARILFKFIIHPSYARALKHGMVKSTILRKCLLASILVRVAILFLLLLFFLHTLFQFGMTIAPIQNKGLINAKQNNTLHGTIIA